MVSLVIKSYQGIPLNKDVISIRQKVFIDEQRVPEKLEWDEEDKISMHVVAYNNKKAVANARYYQKNNEAYLGRMAVLPDFRRRGIGKMLLKYCINELQKLPVKQIILHAQEAVIEFYQQQGFKVSGDTFYEAQIPHKKMSLNLT